MHHRSLDELRDVARVDEKPAPVLTRQERLARWAELLARDPGRQLRTLPEIELMPRSERAGVRVDDSALSVAYADPMLRTAGLAGDRLGDAMQFFDLSWGEAHRLLCSCMHGRSVDAGTMSRLVSNIGRPGLSHASLWAFVGVVTTAPVALVLFL